MAKILASSLDNFILLENSHTVEQPYVTFTVGSPTDVKIKIKDKNNDDGYNKVIVGNATSTISSDSFNTGGIVAINLMECLKQNSIFFNLTLLGTTVRAMIDTSISYEITVEGGGITVGGTYSSYEALSPNKMVVMLQGDIDSNTTNISLEKYNNNPTVSFNITSPFRYQTRKNPIKVGITAYQVYDSKASTVSVPYQEAIILPTTLTKFQNVDYSLYLYDGGSKVNFLTTNTNRIYNYDEWVSLSLLLDESIQSEFTLKKDYYTNSGVYLKSDYTTQYSERNGIRLDFIDNFNLNDVENEFNKQVGYIMVYAWNGTAEITNGIRFDIKPHCDGNNVLYFLNEIGGIDSFNFTNKKTIERKIADQSSYFVNKVAPYSDTYEMEYTKQKKNEITYTLSTHVIDKATAEWLNELNKSKYVFLWNSFEQPMYTMVIINKFDIETNSKDNEYELSLDYHIADNENNV